MRAAAGIVGMKVDGCTSRRTYALPVSHISCGTLALFLRGKEDSMRGDLIG
jgi:hypothetical protein